MLASYNDEYEHIKEPVARSAHEQLDEQEDTLREIEAILRALSPGKFDNKFGDNQGNK